MCVLYCWNSFVPRPFPPPVFDRLQYAKMEGEELGDLVMCMMSGGQRVDRWGAQCAIVVTHKLCDDQSQIYQTMRCIDSLSNNTVSSSWTQYCKKDLEILHWALPPVCLPIVRSHTVHMTKFPRPSFSVFAYSKQSKTEGRAGLGTRLLLKHLRAYAIPVLSSQLAAWSPFLPAEGSLITSKVRQKGPL